MVEARAGDGEHRDHHDDEVKHVVLRPQKLLEPVARLGEEVDGELDDKEGRQRKVDPEKEEV